MNNALRYLRKHRDTALLATAMLCLVLAMFRPTIPVKHNIYTYFMVADISQSMNAVDVSLDGKPASRMAYTQRLMHDVIASMPCNTKVGIGLFAGNSIAAMYQPIEVCQNFSALQDTIDHLDWRNAWSGNSRVRESLYSAARTIRGFPESAQLVLFTDGEEAPKLHAFNTKNLDGFQGADGWLFVGIGSEKGVAIPKLSDKNQVIGYWANDSFAMQPGIAQISESTLGVRDDSVANAEHDRFISKHQAEYLQNVAKEIGASYVNGNDTVKVLQAMQAQKPARRDVAPFDLHWILATLSGLLLLAAYINKHSVKLLAEKLHLYKRKQHARAIDNESAVAHDNQFVN